jgi:opacity protein-like surface antigen
MRKTVLAIATLLGLAGMAQAADLPMKAAPVPPPVPAWSWAGFYIGGHGGYGWKENDFQEVISTSPLLTIGDIKSNGAVYGGQIGYNWQYGLFVGGLELDMSATSISGDSDPVVRTFAGGLTITDTRSDDVKYLGTVRGRFGYAAFTGCCWNALLYGTGGLAWERVNRIDSEIVITPAITQTAVTTQPRDNFGWVVGVGGELQVTNTNWIVRLEYLHYDFGQVESTTSVTSSPGTSFADNGGKQTINVVRGGLSYKFTP